MFPFSWCFVTTIEKNLRQKVKPDKALVWKKSLGTDPWGECGLCPCSKHSLYLGSWIAETGKTGSFGLQSLAGTIQIQKCTGFPGMCSTVYTQHLATLPIQQSKSMSAIRITRAVFLPLECASNDSNFLGTKAWCCVDSTVYAHNASFRKMVLRYTCPVSAGHI